MYFRKRGFILHNGRIIKRLSRAAFPLYHFLIQFRRRFRDQFLRALDQTFDEGVNLAALVKQGQRPVQVKERVRGIVFQHIRVQERRAKTQVDVGDGIALVVVGHAAVHRHKIEVQRMLLILLDVIAVPVHIAQLIHAARVLEQERTQRPVLIRLPVVHLLMPAVVVAVAQVADGFFLPGVRGDLVEARRFLGGQRSAGGSLLFFLLQAHCSTGGEACQRQETDERTCDLLVGLKGS